MEGVKDSDVEPVVLSAPFAKVLEIVDELLNLSNDTFDSEEAVGHSVNSVWKIACCHTTNTNTVVLYTLDVTIEESLRV